MPAGLREMIANVGTDAATTARTPRAMGARMGALTGTLATLGYGLVRFESTTDFLESVDRGPRLFFDFIHYYEATARSFAAGENEALGYLYSPFLAVGLIPWVSLGPVASFAFWALVQAACLSLLIFRAMSLGPPGFSGGFAAAVLTLLSTASLHSFKWGQVGLLLAVLMLEALVALERRRDASASVLLGSAVALKFYPAILLPLVVVARRLRFAAGVAVATAALLLLPSFAVLGIRRTRNFYRRLSEALSGTGGALDDSNSQAVAAWLARAFAFDNPARVALFAGCLLVLLIVLGLVLRRRSAPLESRIVFGGLLLTSLVPFFVPTCWPAYFCLLPVLTLMVAEGWRSQHRSTPRSVAMMALAIAGIAQIFPAVDVAGGWLAYVERGWLLLASLTVTACGLPLLFASRAAQLPDERRQANAT